MTTKAVKKANDRKRHCPNCDSELYFSRDAWICPNEDCNYKFRKTFLCKARFDNFLNGHILEAPKDYLFQIPDGRLNPQIIIKHERVIREIREHEKNFPKAKVD